jgi:hypothetical protein
MFLTILIKIFKLFCFILDETLKIRIRSPFSIATQMVVFFQSKHLLSNPFGWCLRTVRFVSVTKTLDLLKISIMKFRQEAISFEKSYSHMKIFAPQELCHTSLPFKLVLNTQKSYTASVVEGLESMTSNPVTSLA